MGHEIGAGLAPARVDNQTIFLRSAETADLPTDILSFLDQSFFLALFFLFLLLFFFFFVSFILFFLSSFLSQNDSLTKRVDSSRSVIF